MTIITAPDGLSSISFSPDPDSAHSFKVTVRDLPDGSVVETVMSWENTLRFWEAAKKDGFKYTSSSNHQPPTN